MATLAPRTATAGKHVSVVFPVTRSDNGAPLTGATIACTPSVQGKPIAHTESFTGGAAHVAFTIPRSAKGKLVTVKLAITVGGVQTTKVFSFRAH